MFERFTEKAIKVIMLAQEESRRLGHHFVGSEQILLGLIGEGTGAAAITLQSCGVTLKAARAEVETIIGRGSGFVGPEIPFTPSAKKLLELSWDQARQLGDCFVGTEHLLMGLIAGGSSIEGSSVGMRVLENLQADLTGLRAQLLYVRFEEAKPLQEPLLSTVVERLSGKQKTPDILSSSATKVLELARLGTRAAGHRIVGSDQLLLAILIDGKSIAADALAESGVTLDNARTQAERIAGLGPGDLGQELRNTPRTDRIIGLAHRKAHRLRKVETDIDHLLLGLLAEYTGLGAQILHQMGINRDQIRAALLNKLQIAG